MKIEEIKEILEIINNYFNKQKDKTEIRIKIFILGIKLEIVGQSLSPAEEMEVKQVKQTDLYLPKQQGKETPEGELVIIRSSEVGQFTSFVKIEEKVKKGEKIGLLEVLSLKMEIVSPCDGEIIYCITSEEKIPVEFGEILFKIKMI